MNYKNAMEIIEWLFKLWPELKNPKSSKYISEEKIKNWVNELKKHDRWDVEQAIRNHEKEYHAAPTRKQVILSIAKIKDYKQKKKADEAQYRSPMGPEELKEIMKIKEIIEERKMNPVKALAYHIGNLLHCISFQIQHDVSSPFIIKYQDKVIYELRRMNEINFGRFDELIEATYENIRTYNTCYPGYSTNIKVYDKEGNEIKKEIFHACTTSIQNEAREQVTELIKKEVNLLKEVPF